MTLGNSVKSVLMKYLGVNSNVLGYIEYDDAVWNSVRKKVPLINAYPASNSAKNITRITEDLL